MPVTYKWGAAANELLDHQMEVQMKRMSIAELIPGMVAAEDILSHSGQTLIPKGTIFTENMIARLENYCIYYANIEDDKVSGLSCPLIPHETEPDPAGKNSSFVSAFKHCSEYFRMVLTGSISKNQPFSSDDLLRKVMALLPQDGKNDAILDILLNMRHMDDTVYSHCISVALLSNLISCWLGFSKKDQLTATACGLFHDCGMLVLPSGIMEKSGKYTHKEFNILKTHPIEGFHLLSKYRDISEEVRDAALTHHERCDGSGYPYGLNNDDISRFAKIIMIADIFDTMISNKSYRMSMCAFSLIKYFEDDGIQKYDVEYLLTFIEHVLNFYLKNKVILHSGMDGNVILIKHGFFPRPAVHTECSKDLQDDYYNSILMLSNMENLSIESII